jgi:hypothetical protein
MNTEQTIERIEELTSKLAKLTYKLRAKNDRAGYLAAIVAAQISTDRSY